MCLPVLEIWLNNIVTLNKETRSSAAERMVAGIASALRLFLLPVFSSLTRLQAHPSSRGLFDVLFANIAPESIDAN